jgi:hypothetical protein
MLSVVECPEYSDVDIAGTHWSKEERQFPGKKK